MWKSYCGTPELHGVRTPGTTGEHQAGCSKRPSSKATADESTVCVPLRYVEDAFEARTQLADFFSILLQAHDQLQQERA